MGVLPKCMTHKGLEDPSSAVDFNLRRTRAEVTQSQPRCPVTPIISCTSTLFALETKEPSNACSHLICRNGARTPVQEQKATRRPVFYHV